MITSTWGNTVSSSRGAPARLWRARPNGSLDLHGQRARRPRRRDDRWAAGRRRGPARRGGAAPGGAGRPACPPTGSRSVSTGVRRLPMLVAATSTRAASPAWTLAGVSVRRTRSRGRRDADVEHRHEREDHERGADDVQLDEAEQPGGQEGDGRPDEERPTLAGEHELPRRRDRHRGEHVLHHGAGVGALELRVGREHEPVGQHRAGEGLHVVGDDVVAARRRSPGAGRRAAATAWPGATCRGATPGWRREASARSTR